MHPHLFFLLPYRPTHRTADTTALLSTFAATHHAAFGHSYKTANDATVPATHG